MTAFEWDREENEFGLEHLSCGVLDRNGSDVLLEVDETPTGQWDWRIYNDVGDIKAQGREKNVYNALSAAIEGCFDNCYMR